MHCILEQPATTSATTMKTPVPVIQSTPLSKQSTPLSKKFNGILMVHTFRMFHTRGLYQRVLTSREPYIYIN
jgi:hypothetical protein